MWTRQDIPSLLLQWISWAEKKIYDILRTNCRDSLSFKYLQEQEGAIKLGILFVLWRFQILILNCINFPFSFNFMTTLLLELVFSWSLGWLRATTHHPKVEVIIKQENIFLTSLLLPIDGCPLVAWDKPQKGDVKDFISAFMSYFLEVQGSKSNQFNVFV